MEIAFCNLVVLSVGGLLLYTIGKYVLNRRKQQTWDKWAEESRSNKRQVILHGLYGGRHTPSPSPFVMKVETYLRMVKIPYEVDKSDVWGPKGKSPWISVQGQNIADSQMIIEFLGKKFEKRLGSCYSDEQRAVGTTVRVMVDEYLYWGGVLWTFAFGGRLTWGMLRRNEITFKEWMIFQMIAPSLTSMAYTQGLGRHTEEEVISSMKKCLHAISKILGDKTFLLGEEPCEDDCALFAQLAPAVFQKNSPFQSQLSGDLRNLKNYCIRMKEKYWPDWDSLLIHP